MLVWLRNFIWQIEPQLPLPSKISMRSSNFAGDPFFEPPFLKGRFQPQKKTFRNLSDLLPLQAIEIDLFFWKTFFQNDKFWLGSWLLVWCSKSRSFGHENRRHLTTCVFGNPNHFRNQQVKWWQILPDIIRKCSKYFLTFRGVTG